MTFPILTHSLTLVVKFTLLALVVVSPSRASALQAKLSDSASGATLSLYRDECEEDAYAECVVADLGCDATGTFQASLVGLTIETVGAWLARESGTAILVVGRERVMLRALKLERSDLTGDWDATLTVSGDASGIWRSLASAGPKSLLVAKRTIAVPQAGPAGRAFSGMLKRCASR